MVDSILNAKFGVQNLSIGERERFVVLVNGVGGGTSTPSKRRIGSEAIILKSDAPQYS